MYIYFIRHGETDYNRKHIHQHEAVPLSGNGKQQIERAAERLKEIPITKLISSDMTRAYESATIIGDALDLEPQLHPLFREVKRPSELYGMHHYNGVSLAAGIQMLLNLHRREWHYSDEENLYDIRARVIHAVEHLREVGKEHEHVAVVSHAFILNMFIKYMCQFKGVRVRDYLRTLFAAKRLSNASISTLQFNDDRNPYTCDWICLKINDTGHLE